jgi:uncharacterized protein YcaQ
MSTLTAAQARRVAVAAQGLAEPKPAGPITRAHLKRLISRIQVLQLDSVSVAVRAHYAPVFSRLGPYDRDVLDRAAWGPRSARLLAEYWAHEAALMAVDDWPLLRWRMWQYRHGRWRTQVAKSNPQLAEDIVAAVAELGPSTAGQIEAHLAAEPRRAKGAWWHRSDTKWVAEALVCLRCAHHGHQGGLRPALRPGGEGAATECAGPRGRRRRGRPRAHVAGRHRAGCRHRGRHPRLLPGVVVLITCSPCINAGS